MILLSHYKNRKIAVFGLGKAGLAAVSALIASGAEVFAWDDKEASRNAAQGATILPIEAWDWAALAGVVLSPGVPFTHPEPHDVVKQAQKASVPVFGEVDLLYQACPNAHYIGITGTNGKSTTTALIAHILEQCGLKMQVGGNLGTPALELEPLGKDGWYVIEMSSYQLDLTHHARFNAAILLNLTPDHLDRHGDMAGYIKAKRRIFDRQREGDVALIALDDADTKAVFDTTPHAKSFSVTQKADVFVDENGVLIDGALRFDLTHVKRLKGRHNWQNIAAAYSAARHAGLEGTRIMDAVHGFAGLPHRLELVGEQNGVTFINDSKATNADATQHALAPFTQIHWILGGKAKAGGIESLTAFFPKIAHAYLIGEAAEVFAQTLEGKVPYTQCGTLENATKLAAQHANSGSVVLLSPACASFDQWKSYEHRGDAFRDYVKALM